ncbi:MAG: TonB-dependent receptor [candidate division KSB1 bacterium]|nr:TonB-dependent receptor [candidate division KSB1 bacterium]
MRSVNKIAVAVILLAALLPVSLFAAVYGKISGKVVDSETNEPLPAANVVVVGTDYGAATNVNGEFVILNVPPGQYSVRAQFIGYRPVTYEEVLVNVDLTTQLTFELPAEAIAGEEVVITATRPLINKNATNETAIMTSEDIENMPLRSMAGAVATNTGVVTAGGDMYVRGGRADEVAFYVDGVYSNNLRTGQRVGTVPVTSLEQINYQAGGFSAEYGFANSGVVIASTKSGAKQFKLSGEVITDEFLSKEEDFLDTYSYGYNVYNLSVTGPLLSNKISYFASVEHSYEQDRNPSASGHPVLDGNYTYDEITLSQAELQEMGVPEEEWILPVRMQEGPLPGNWVKEWAFNGNLQFDLKPVRIKLGGNASFQDWRAYSHFRSLGSIEDNYAREDYNYSVYGKVTHTLGPKTYYEATAYYSAFGDEDYNPDAKRHMADYADKTDFNDNGLFNDFLVADGIPRSSYYRLGSGIFAPPHYPALAYNLNRANVLGGKLDFTHQIGTTHEIKTGFEYRYNTMRRYNTQSYRLAGTFSNNPDIDPINAYRAAYTENFGYPVYFDGNEVDPSATLDEGRDAAKHPLIGAFYVQDKIELSDLVLNLGLRVDYMDANDQTVKDPYDIQIENGLIAEESLTETEAHINVSPRLGMSFPVTDRTVFHAQYGQFVQQPQLQFLYTGWAYYAAQLVQGNQVDIGNPDLAPVRTTSYEVGIGQQLSNTSSLSITAYYKEISDNVVLKNRVGASPSTYAQYQNGDYGVVKGMSFTYKLRPTNGLRANLNYTLQYAKGTGSTSRGNFYVTWIGDEYYPIFVSPLDYDQRHTFSGNLDYRVSGWGANLLFQAGSGFPYTPKRIADTVFGATNSTSYPVGGVNSVYTDWTYSLDLRLDKSFELAGVDMNVYVWILNVLDTKQPFNRRDDRGQSYGSGIYEATGLPNDNGWLSTADGQNWMSQYEGDNAENMYRAFINDPNNWETPRQIRLGLRFSL